MTAVCVLTGFTFVVTVLVDAFESVVLPRRVTRPFRLARTYYRLTWHVWTGLARLTPPGRPRLSMLSAYGPLSLLTLFTLWAAGLIVGFGLLHHAAAPGGRPFGESLYLSGTTFTTLGDGDVTPAGPAGRLLGVVEALLGFGFLAVIVGYLPVFYQAFSRRELAISLLDARAGSPPSGGELLLRLPPGTPALGRALEDLERWSAEVLESHLSYPVLSYYRSQHDNQSWLAALVCALDACALLLTVAKGGEHQQARLTFAMARHTLVDLALVLRQPPRGSGADRMPHDRLLALVGAMKAAGATVREDAKDEAKLVELRGLYEPFARALADYPRLDLAEVWRERGRPDNWQTSAWTKRAENLADDHFD